MRYRISDLPAKGVGAFTPTMSTNPTASSWGLVRRMGSPGTTPIPAPKPEGTPDFSLDPRSVGSNVAPDIMLPAIYVAYADNMGPSADAGVGMAARRTNPLPVPALSWISTAKKAMITPKIGGRSAATWPRAFQRFPNVNGGNQSAT